MGPGGIIHVPAARVAWIMLAVTLLGGFSPQPGLLTQQSRYERVRTAQREKQSGLEKMLGDHNITLQNLNLLLVAYKEEGILDVFAKTANEERFRRIHSYSICARSGRLGPKRRQGDGQVPEGFYHINRLNPQSSYYLSLGINYPNASDRKKTAARDPGGDIFIHGSCVTIGCLPMTDESIKEIYLLVVHAMNNGQTRVPVYIFPFRMSDLATESFKSKHSGDDALLLFWDNLKRGYDLFIHDHKALRTGVQENGDYTFRRQMARQ